MTTRTPAGNRGFAKKRVQWLIEHSTSHQLLWCIDSFVLRNPPLRQAPKRYGQVKKEKRSAKANGLTTQCDKKRVLLNFKSGDQNPLKKTGRNPKILKSWKI